MRPLAVLSLVVVAVFVLSADDCSSSAPPSDRAQQTAQEAMTQQANAQIGMPGITNFTEKKLMKKIYELRDQNIATFSYVPDFQGRLWHLCDSIGYGLPYGTQFSNPEKITQSLSQSYGTLPQSEPNGLFMPPSAEGTWVMCVDEKQKGNFQPVYVEPRVIVSPFKLRSEGEYELQ